MAASEASDMKKDILGLVTNLENRAASAQKDWHCGLKNETKMTLEMINHAVDAKRISPEDSLRLKNRVYCIQDKLIELALW